MYVNAFEGRGTVGSLLLETEFLSLKKVFGSLGAYNWIVFYLQLEPFLTAGTLFYLTSTSRDSQQRSSTVSKKDPNCEQNSCIHKTMPLRDGVPLKSLLSTSGFWNVAFV